MTVETTGSTVVGLNDGMSNGTMLPVVYVLGDPDEVVTSTVASGIALDVANGNYYIAKTTNGSTWYNLGSVSD